ncbi:hypothetical protein I7I53_04181 [Histoplasma capsulatum var. duboisii H88]|uniref:Uncharacterized protein n=1 Tax=Ajellomyces capsulatus (strain H88) TaxID=544711 RepID=A0A8A1LRX2_AJEC8|nr:hypothetical protein I7I53_04181 [Histoplasma capsulatum var. duboisii H88]
MRFPPDTMDEAGFLTPNLTRRKIDPGDVASDRASSFCFASLNCICARRVDCGKNVCLML